MARLNLVVIVGEAGSGKDSLAKALVKYYGPKAHEVISYTTRPPRDYEKNGVDYYFIDNLSLAKLIFDNKILEATEFNNWFYATGIDKLEPDKINIAVLNPEGVMNISDDDRVDLFLIKCCCSDKQRLIRQLSREENPNIEEIIRRYKSDKEDFSGFDVAKYSKDWDVITTEGVTIQQEVDMVVDFIDLWAKKDN